MSTVLTEPYIRASQLNGLAEFLSEQRIELRELLHEVGIPEPALDDPTMLISIVGYNDLLNRIADETGNPNVGLTLVTTEKGVMENIGPLALILKMGDTTGECVVNALRFKRYHTNGVILEVIEHPQEGLGECRYTPLYPLKNVRQLTENAIGLARTAMRFLLSDENSAPAGVSFQHSRPDETELHEEFFNCPVTFDQATNSLFFDIELLRVPTIGADENISQVVYDFFQKEISKVEENLSVTEIVTGLVSQLLPSGNVGIDLVAKAMAIHPKTIQRRLEKEDVTYKEIVQKVRAQTAVRLLSETKIPNASVAALCGYSNPAAFNNAFRNWYGCTPGEYRKTKPA